MRVLYHGSTMCHILSCIVHRLAYHEEDEATLMIVEFYATLPVLEQFADKMKSLGLFNEILIVPEGTFKKKRGMNLKNDSSVEEIEQVITNICSEFDAWYPNVREFDEINIAADQWTLGVYCLWHKIPFNYFEDGCGMLSDLKRYYDIVKSMDVANYMISKYLGGVGQSSVVSKLYCNVEYQKEELTDERVVDFSIYDILKNKIPHKVNTILKLYDCEPYEMSDDKPVVLFLTQYIRTLAIKDLNVQRDITTLLLDYFAREAQVVFKAHPKDMYFKYDELIKDAYVIRRNLPSELLPFMFTKMLKRVITASSTSIGGVSMVAEESYSFTTDIEVNYSYLHIANAIVRIIKAVEEERNIVINLKEDLYIENFMKLYGISRNDKVRHENSIFVETDGSAKIHTLIQLDKIKDKDIIIFDNYKNNFKFLKKYPDLSSENLIAWNLQIRNKRGNYIDIERQIWVYCKDGRMREKIGKMEFVEELTYSGKEVVMKPQEINDMLIMKGKMKALEYALSNNSKQDKTLASIMTILNKHQEKEEQSEKFLLRDGILDYRN